MAQEEKDKSLANPGEEFQCMTINQGSRQVPAHQCSCLAQGGGSQFTPGGPPVLSGVRVTSVPSWYSSAQGSSECLGWWVVAPGQGHGHVQAPGPPLLCSFGGELKQSQNWCPTSSVIPKELQALPRDQAAVMSRTNWEFEVKTSCTAKKSFYYKLWV